MTIEEKRIELNNLLEKLDISNKSTPNLEKMLDDAVTLIMSTKKEFENVISLKNIKKDSSLEAKNRNDLIELYIGKFASSEFIYFIKTSAIHERDSALSVCYSRKQIERDQEIYIDPKKAFKNIYPRKLDFYAICLGFEGFFDAKNYDFDIGQKRKKINKKEKEKNSFNVKNKEFISLNESLENKWEENIILGNHEPKNIFSSNRNIFKLLVLPFEDNEGDKFYKLEKKFLRRFEEIKKTELSQIEVKFLRDRKITPLHFDHAEVITEKYCSDLTIWGSYLESGNNKGEISIKFSLSQRIFDLLSSYTVIEAGKSLKKTKYSKTKLSLLRRGHLQGRIDSVMYWVLGVYSLSSKDYEGALDMFNRVANLSNKNFDIWIYIGITQVNLNNFEGALKSANNGLSIKPNDVCLLSNKGTFLQALGRNMEAIEFYYKVLEQNPKLEFVWINIATLQGQEKNYDKALDIFDTIGDQVDELKFVFWFNKGNLLAEMGKIDEAIEAYDNISVFNENIEGESLWYNKAHLLQTMGRNKEADLAYDQVIKINPKKAIAWSDKGNNMQEMGMINKALMAYDKALSIDDSIDIIWYNKGNLLKEKGRNDEALEAFKKAVEINPDFLAALEKMKNLGGVDPLIVYERAVYKDIYNVNAWNDLGLYLINSGRKDKAIEIYRIAVETNPHHLNAWFNLGMLLAEKDELDEALKAFEIVIKFKGSKIADSYYCKGYILEKKGKIKEAIISFEKALDVDSNHFQSKNDLAKLKNKFS
jgi:tetratricopeptide (TPR) repeat protein